MWGVGRVTLQRLHGAGIRTIGDLARTDTGALASRFGSLGTHLAELAHGRDPRSVVADWQRKSYGEENTFEHDQELDATKLRSTLIAHGEALARRLRADSVRARTITLKLKLARPLGEGRYPQITRSFSLKGATDDGAEITRVALSLLSQVKRGEKIVWPEFRSIISNAPIASQLGLFGPERSSQQARAAQPGAGQSHRTLRPRSDFTRLRPRRKSRTHHAHQVIGLSFPSFRS